jgi:hypothetical protein
VTCSSAFAHIDSSFVVYALGEYFQCSGHFSLSSLSECDDRNCMADSTDKGFKTLGPPNRYRSSSRHRKHVKQLEPTYSSSCAWLKPLLACRHSRSSEAAPWTLVPLLKLQFAKQYLCKDHYTPCVFCHDDSSYPTTMLVTRHLSRCIWGSISTANTRSSSLIASRCQAATQQQQITTISAPRSR